MRAIRAVVLLRAGREKHVEEERIGKRIKPAVEEALTTAKPSRRLTVLLDDARRRRHREASSGEAGGRRVSTSHGADPVDKTAAEPQLLWPWSPGS